VVIECPYCGSEMVLKGLRPGEFAPTCTNCRQRFDLIVPNDPKSAPTVRPIVVKNPDVGQMGINAAGVDHPAASVRKDASVPSQKHLTGRLGGYEIEKLLARGTMGSVYLARQLSLGRKVAIKTLHKSLAADQELLTRFTREAYAAAMLQHPNIVQIYDFGVDRGIHFFSMEYVSGISLTQLIQQRGRIESKLAASYVVQASRGLGFAHDHGLIHRDVKPDNLLLGEDGMLKLADLGLVRQVASRRQPVMAPAGADHETNPHVTHPYHAMGTPTYMAPEQARDAASADGRADIYSLGCTFYMLLTGRPPFQEKTTQAMLEAHATQQAPPPDMLVEGVSGDLSTIVMKMLARRPGDRYQNMHDVRAALEQYLQVNAAGAARLKGNEIESLAAAAEQLKKSPWPKIQIALAATFFLICITGGAGAVLMPQSSVHKSLSLAAVLTVMLGTSLTYLLIHSAAYRSPLFSRFRQIAMPDGWSDLMGFKFIVPTVMVVLLLYALNVLWVAVALVIISVGLAVIVHLLIDKRAEAAKTEAAKQAEKIVFDLRQRGVDEQVIRNVVRSETGPKLRGMFESIFGQEADVSANAMSDDASLQQKWVNKLIDKADAKLQRRWENQKRQLLAAMEARWRIGAGTNLAEARQEAMESADEFVRGAAVVRQMAHQAAAAAIAAAKEEETTETHRAGSPIPTELKGAMVPRNWTDRPADLLVEFVPAEAGGRPRRKKLDYLGALEGYEKTSFFRRRFGSPAELIFSAVPRLLLAGIILAGFMAWCLVNKGNTLNNFLMSSGSMHDLKPLRVAALPNVLCDAVSGFWALAAGLVLGLSIFFNGHLYAVCVFLSAAVLLFGAEFYVGTYGTLFISGVAAIFLVCGILLRQTVE
jgi:eukaryotic-like serine/threonine-protein kinase